MSTKFFSRPSASYTGEAGLVNRTKYNDDSTASPRRPISSTKVDGDVNYLIDAVNTLYDTAVSGVVADNSITDAKLRDSAGLSVIGRSANSSGNPADIVAASDDQVLRRNGTSIGFGQVATAGLADSAVTTAKIADTNVTFAKIQNVSTGVVLGRSSSGAGSVESLTVSNGLAVAGSSLSGVAATDSVVGVVELATSSEIRTGTDTTRAITPAGLLAAQGYVSEYNSGQISFTAGGGGTLAHGLGRRPIKFQAFYECTTAQGNYQVGDILLAAGNSDNNTSIGVHVWTRGTTEILWRIGSTGVVLNDATTGTQFLMTTTSWRLIVRAWA
jgi:hypothetical protein